ncbi:TIGR01440 family protein [Caproicibacterium sp. NSD3]
MKSFEELHQQAKAAAAELLEAAHMKAGQLMVVGCSSSEVVGKKIGTDSSLKAAQEIFSGIYEETQKRGVYLAAQCCEHLNRSLILPQEAAEKFHYEQVNVVPQPHAGGSFATTAYQTFEHPVAVEEIRADCGMDIGGTLIGMHLKRVAVPTRLSIDHIGEAILICARTRAKYVGGPRAHYDDRLM